MGFFLHHFISTLVFFHRWDLSGIVLGLKHVPRQEVTDVTLDKESARCLGCGVVGWLVSCLRRSASGRHSLLEARVSLALCIHSVYSYRCLQVVAVMECGVVQAIVVELVTEEGSRLRWGVQV